MRNKDIGIVVWGCKGGYRVFCSQGVNVKEKSIIDTIKDIRSFVRFNQVNLTTYALEFTEDYKVFTVYRSCNDSGIGAFVAITIYVPHSLKVQNIRTSLDIAIDLYFKEFIHPVFGTYLDGKYDSIDQYQSLLESLDVVDDLLYDYRPSVQDDCPHLRLYDNISEVDSFFDSPYRKEFFGCQEVMFMSRNLYNSGADSLRFNFNENIIEKVSDPNTPPVISVASTPGVIYFEINGTEHPITYNLPVNILKDVVTIKLQKDFCEDYIIKGRIDKLINQNLLVESNKTISIRLSSISWVYKQYDIRFTLKGTFIPDNLIYIEDGAHPIRDQKIRIDGSALKTQKKIFLRPCCLDTTLAHIGTIVPANYISEGVDIKLEKHDFFVDIAQGISSDETIIIYPGSRIPTIKIPISSLKDRRKIELYLPEGLDLNNSSFDTSTEYTKFELSNNTLRLLPRELEYNIQLPDEVKGNIKKWDFIINKESKKINNFFNRDYKVKIDPSDRVESGILSINNYQYTYIIENNTIIPKIVYIRFNDSNCECKTRWLRQNVMVYGDTILPFVNIANVKVGIDEGKFTSKIEPKNQFFIELIISRKTPESIVQHVSELPEQNLNHKVLIENCSSFYYQNKDNITIQLPKKKEISLTKSSFSLFNKKGEKCCVIFNSQSDYTDEIREVNERNGFNISYTENCIKVTHTKKSIFPIPGINTIKFSLLGVLLVLIAIFSLYLIFYSGKTPALNICFEISDNEFNEEIKGIKLNTENDYITINQDSIVVIEWDNKFVDNYQLIISQNLSLDFGNDIQKNISLSDDPKIAKALEELKRIKDKKELSVSSIRVSVESPLQKLLSHVVQIENEYQDNNIEGLYSSYSKYMNETENTSFHTNILKRAKVILAEDTQQHDLYLRSFKMYKTNPIYQDVKNRRESLATENDIIQKEQKRLAELQAIAVGKKTLLHNLNCNVNTVNSIEQWYNSLSANDKSIINSNFNFEKAIADYKVFFLASSLTDITRLTNQNNGRKSFSDPQWKVILRGYGQNTSTFENWKKEMGMSFSEPYKNEYLKQ